MSDRPRLARPLHMNNELIVLCGISGSGKSTLAQQLLSTLTLRGPTRRREGDEPARFVIVSADHYFLDDDGVYRFDGSKIGDAHAQCFRRAIDAVQRGHLVIVDNTSCSIAEIAPYMALAQAYNRPARIIKVQCDIETAVARNEHGVPRAAIERMAAALSSMVLPPWWACEIL